MVRKVGRLQRDEKPTANLFDSGATWVQFRPGWIERGGAVNLPSAPAPQAPSQPTRPTATPMGPQATVPQNPPGTPTTLSLKDAQALALKNNPQISVARLTALASIQVTREVRSNLWPTASIELTAVDANPGTRLTAGALNNPILYQRAAAGSHGEPANHRFRTHHEPDFESPPSEVQRFCILHE